ncbi:hypothetical protein BH24ACI5_BH24ACI5_05870 [soil metagenome]
MLHQVGVGALGPVFRTYEPTRDRLVAVKVFRLDVTPEQAQALADEFSVAAEAGLFHPSVVEPIAAGVEGTVAYRAEEYVAAETLDVALRHYAPAPIDKVLPLITQLAGAIDFARTAGVGHGALHPRDIFVTPEEARATGFGVVEALERVGIRAPVRRPYSAPERVAGNRWGTPADVFSLAAIAYELLTGHRPAGTGSQIGGVAGTSAGHHPGAVHAVFVRAMDDDPARRYQSALAFASALDAAANGEAEDDSESPAAAAGLTAAAVGEDVETKAEGVPHAEGSEFNDVVAEREEDEAHAALLAAEQEVAAVELESPREHFLDAEGVDDLALDVPQAERFADDFGLVAAAADADPADARVDDEDETAEALDPAYEADAAPDRAEPMAVYEAGPAADYAHAEAAAPVFHDRPGSSFRSRAVIAVLGLLVGFAGGYAVGTRTPAISSGADASGDLVAGAGTDETAKPYSEETVAPAQPPAATTGAPAGTGEATPPVAPAPASPKSETRAATGSVVVRSTPPGANVTIEGRWRGRTPLTLDKLAFGAHQIRVVQSGYAVATEEVTLSASTPSRTLSFRLQRSAPAAQPRPTSPPPGQASRPQSYIGSIYVDSRPRGARVLLDGKPMGTTPVRIPDVAIGSRIIRLQLEDHRDWTTSTRVVAGQETRVSGSLEQIR